MLSFEHETEIPHRIFPYGHQPRCLRITDSQPRAHRSATNISCGPDIAASIGRGFQLNTAASIGRGFQLNTAASIGRRSQPNGQSRSSQRIG